MRLVCPNCRGIASLEAWENEPVVMEFITIRATLPGNVNGLVTAYLRLFRPEKGPGLSWKKALRLIIELRDLVAAGHVQWKRKPARPCPPAVWAEAMERITTRPPSDLPLGSHGYLTSIAYSLADDADRAAETARNAAERSGAARPVRDGGLETIEEISREELRRIREENRRKHR